MIIILIWCTCFNTWILFISIICLWTHNFLIINIRRLCIEVFSVINRVSELWHILVSIRPVSVFNRMESVNLLCDIGHLSEGLLVHILLNWSILGVVHHFSHCERFDLISVESLSWASVIAEGIIWIIALGCKFCVRLFIIRPWSHHRCHSFCLIDVSNSLGHVVFVFQDVGTKLMCVEWEFLCLAEKVTLSVHPTLQPTVHVKSRCLREPSELVRLASPLPRVSSSVTPFHFNFIFK